MDVPQFVETFTYEGHESSFQSLTIANNAAVSIHMQVFLSLSIHFAGKNAIASHRVVNLDLKETDKLFLVKWLYHFTFVSEMYESSSFCKSLQESGVVTIFKFYSLQWLLIVVLFCTLLTANDVGCVFMCLLPIHISSSVKCLFIYLLY